MRYLLLAALLFGANTALAQSAPAPAAPAAAASVAPVDTKAEVARLRAERLATLKAQKTALEKEVSDASAKCEVVLQEYRGVEGRFQEIETEIAAAVGPELEPYRTQLGALREAEKANMDTAKGKAVQAGVEALATRAKEELLAQVNSEIGRIEAAMAQAAGAPAPQASSAGPAAAPPHAPAARPPASTTTATATVAAPPAPKPLPPEFRGCYPKEFEPKEPEGDALATATVAATRPPVAQPPARPDDSGRSGGAPAPRPGPAPVHAPASQPAVTRAQDPSLPPGCSYVFGERVCGQGQQTPR
jgi:hypothetical protein